MATRFEDVRTFENRRDDDGNQLGLSAGTRPARANVVTKSVTVVQAGLHEPLPSDATPPPLPSDPDRIETALSYALQAADPYVRQGFTVREDYWGGSLAPGTHRTVVHQLFRGNEYWFWMGTDVDAPFLMHVYDANGERTEAEQWKKPQMAAARVVPTKTDSYYLVIEMGKTGDANSTAAKPVHWALAYGFR